MNELDEKIINEGIRLPLVITDIKTHRAGGHAGKVHFPESALNQVKQLMGTENKIVYMAVLVKLEELEPKPRLKPGPKSKEQE